jgi:hypothetical protein
MLTTQNSEKNTPNWDNHYSTYYWEIFLNPLHKNNNPNVEKLTGYSKKERQSEAQDIAHLLKAKILNLHTNGYFDRSKKIVIYMRAGAIINKRTDPDIITLYPTHYDIAPGNHDYIYKRFAAFLNEFYLRLTEHKSMENILPKLKQRISKDYFTDVTKMSFSNISQLYSHGARLLLHGHSESEVSHFIVKYKELKNWK